MMDISGSMCVHYSSMGNSEKENGISNKLFLIWLKHHGLKRTPLLLHENVQSFPLDYLKERASHYGYTHIARIETSGSDVNLTAVSRKRASLGFAFELIYIYIYIVCFWSGGACGASSNGR